jgi:drug/metabolite transporter (DMT)-like permease
MPQNTLPEAPPQDQLLKAVIFASVNAFMLGVMSLCAKLLAGQYGPVEVTFLRNFTSLALLVTWFTASGHLALTRTTRPGAQLIRAAVGTTGIAMGMWAVSLMPLAEVTVLLFTSPLFTLLLSILFLKERVGPYRICAMIAGFCGVLIVANPLSASGFHLSPLALAVGLSWGFFSGAVDTILRWIGKTENAYTTTFYFLLFGSLLMSPHLPFATFGPAAFSIPILGLIALMGLSGLLAQITKTQSFRYGEATLVSPVMYTMIIWSVLFDYLIWSRLPTINVIAGGMLIIGANLFILAREARLKARTSPARD